MAVLTTGRLPVRLTPLVGRETELGEVTRALAECRLLTLTGPGGTGKTRLALAVATRLAAPDVPRDAVADVAWVELASLNDPQVIAPSVAARLGVPETPGMDLVAAAGAYLAARPDADARGVLLVLDNCEHLASDVAGLAESLLAECPSLTILATSREPLGVEGERSWPVPPLGRVQAARLFEDRARLVAPSFGITDANRQTVTQVCARLDGLPLAIELAAARMRVLSVRQLAQRLDDVFGVLTGGARSAPPRHQTLRATLDWSHDVLTKEERTIFRRLATFAGGFTLAAAEYVTAFADIAPYDVLDLLARLADKSLIQVDNERYHLLATIREYAAEKLARSGEQDQARGAHLVYYTEFAEQAGGRVEQATASELEAELDRLDQEKANLRAATEYARGVGDGVSALRIVGQLGRYAYLRGHYHEVREWMDQAVADSPAAPPGYRARALYGSGRLAHLQCDYESAVRRLDAALLLYRGLGDDTGTAACLQALGSVAREQGRYVRSARLHAEGLELARAAGDARAEASARSYLGFVSWLQSDLDLAVTECTEALSMFRALGDVEGTAWSLISLGVVARYRGDPDEAALLLQESLELSRSIGFREGIAWCEEQLGLVALEQGDLPDAEARLRSSYATHRDLRDRWRMASALEDLAVVFRGDDPPYPPMTVVFRGDDPPYPDPERVAWLLGLAHATREAIGTVLAPCERPQHERSVAVARAALGEAAYEAAWRLGAASSDPGEFEERTRRSPRASARAGASTDHQPQTADRQRVRLDASPRPVPPGLVMSPLTGETPILTGTPPTGAVASPLTAASPILPAPSPVTADSSAGPSPSLAAPPSPSPSQANTSGSAGSVRSPAPPSSPRPPASPGSSGDGTRAAESVRNQGVEVPAQEGGQATVPVVAGPLAGPSGTPASSGPDEGAASVRSGARESAELTGGGPGPVPGPGTAARSARRPAVRVPAQASADKPSGPLRVRALGRATVELGDTALTAADWGYAKPRELLFLLITSRPLTREQLGAALWPELSHKQLGNALHTALRELRRALGDHNWIVYAAGHYSVNRDRAFDCDVDEFESSLADAGRARPASAGLPDLRRAIAAYGGDFLAGMTVGEWAHARRDELRRRFETALLATGRLHMAGGKYQAAVTVFRRAIEHEPLNESAHRELMTCWAQLGENGRAVRHYTELTAMLKEQVGVPPAAETTALAERLAGRN
jgi:predicted ATPase/DNA-binding SARP family transcriptional activator